MNREFFLRTERVGFSKWTREDGALAELLWGNPEVTRFICASGVFSAEDIGARLNKEIENDEKYQVQYWPVFDLESENLVGCCGLRPYSEGKYEIGFHLRPEFWGKGYAVEVANAAIDYAFSVLHAKGLFAGHNPKNVASKKVLGKLGFRYVRDEFYAPTGLYHPSYEMEKPVARSFQGSGNVRKIVFEKIRNARDLGGIKTEDGRNVRAGLLIRSANLFEATEADVKMLEDVYRLAKIVDLRTSVERAEKPDVVPKTTEYMPNPIFDSSVLGISHEKSAEENRNNMKVPAMEELYRMIVTDASCRANLGHAVQMIMEHDFSSGSVLWHCTEGKDRCGLVSAMLLGALGVSREQIMEDYLLTNEVNGPKAEMFYQKMLEAGKSEAEAVAVRNAFIAKDTYLESAFAAIDEQCGDLDVYLVEGLGIPEDVIAEFREKVLE